MAEHEIIKLFNKLPVDKQKIVKDYFKLSTLSKVKDLEEAEEARLLTTALTEEEKDRGIERIKDVDEVNRNENIRLAATEIFNQLYAKKDEAYEIY